MNNLPKKNRIRVWDLPTRLFHWLLVFAFALVWLTQGDDRYLDIHLFAGYLFLGLLGFRLIWGIMGSYYAKFHNFSYNWPTVWHYLTTLFTSKRSHFIGHNPAGSWAIFIILILGLLVAVTGLITLGGEEQHGILAGVIGFATGNYFHGWHELMAWLMLAIVSLHIIGVLVESYLHRENLIKSMITGYKLSTPCDIHVKPGYFTAISLFLAVIIGTLGYFSGYFLSKAEVYRPFIGPKLIQNELWNEACGECHLAYHPNLLPMRSWQKMLSEQDNHFGEDLYLEGETILELLTFASQNAAENEFTEAAWNITHSIPLTKSPLRITKTTYWLEQHIDIPKYIWKHPDIIFQGNCGVCHLDAKLGTFEDAAMYLPN